MMRKTLTSFVIAASVMTVGAFAVTDLGDAHHADAEPLAPVQRNVREVAPIRYDRFEMDVLVDGRPVEEYDSRGRRYVEAMKGAEYELRIRNPLLVRVAVALSVDGLNTIDARRTTRWDASKWVIGPYQTITISGWQMSTARARRFYFTSEQDSYATKLGRASDLGVISAVFYRERPAPDRWRPQPVTPSPRRGSEDAPRSRSENRDNSSSSAPASSPPDGIERRERQEQGAAKRDRDDDYAATGIGRSVNHDVTWVDLTLEPRPVGEVLVRYEYYDALVRLGVFPRPRHDSGGLRRRENARGFEDQRFSPEP
ncbi:MAG: hypothetical protein M3458_11770 [Acidobacteriota bacterium]|nr:hypothetical protein [Acidobacteriota bacterium]